MSVVYEYRYPLVVAVGTIFGVGRSHGGWTVFVVRDLANPLFLSFLWFLRILPLAHALLM